MGDGEKLLTYFNSALKALLGFDIFPRVPKKSEILLPSVIEHTHTTHVTATSLGIAHVVTKQSRFLRYQQKAVALIGLNGFIYLFT